MPGKHVRFNDQVEMLSPSSTATVATGSLAGSPPPPLVHPIPRRQIQFNQPELYSPPPYSTPGPPPSTSTPPPLSPLILPRSRPTLAVASGTPPTPSSTSSERDQDLGSIGESIREMAESPSVKHDRSSSDPSIYGLRTRALLEGWRECILPNRNLYYVHSTRQVVVDVDLRDDGILDAVMAHLESRNDGALVPKHQELWLQNTGSHERGFVPLWCLVDHQERSATFDTPHEASGDSGDDKLNAESCYWSFMEAHPVHAPVPQGAQAEALAALTWNWTDQLLPSRRSAPAPFTPVECREFAALIQSFDKDGGDEQSSLRTHIVARILLRVVRWRQLHTRPDQPLPMGAGSDRSEHTSIETKRPAQPQLQTPEVISIDCGMMPSRTVEMEQRRLASSQRLEQGKVGSEDDRTQFSRLVPFAFDSHPNSSRQQNFGETLNVSSIIYGFKASKPSPSNSSTSDDDSQLQLPANPLHTTASTSKSPHVQGSRPFHTHGWAEYLLPDESVYYVHQAYQVVIDVDLRDEKLLDAVMAYLEDHGDIIPPDKNSGCGTWLVDHSEQSTNGDGEGHHPQHGCGDDRHPAHTSLPSGASQDAMDALNWASTTTSFPPLTPAPFTQKECRSLAALLQSIERRGETPLRTHTVSKILLKVVRWRQSNFRPGKPLPLDAGRDGPRRRHDGLFTAIQSCSQLGYYTPTAIALGSSVTFVQIASIGAVLFSLFLVVPNLDVVAIAKHKADKRSMR
ncbi:hypothetical protein BD779DRAFT_1537099 [Infundibulicybe gibba]|nr:hypothetical protein BD779DRAFT_1537099 [Infundibulicybe gibba]